MIREPKPTVEVVTTRTTQGAGRWAFCNYCYRHVQPYILMEESRFERSRILRCSECDSGLLLLERTR
jgi:hypothetical protein